MFFNEPATATFLHRNQPHLFGRQPARAAGFAGRKDSPAARTREAVQLGSQQADRGECGDGPALTAEEVFRRYAGRIYNLARRLLNNEADVEDVTQEVLLLVVRKLGSYRGEADVATWLHRVTVNAALVHRRKHAPRLAREAGADPRLLEDKGRPLPSASPAAAGPDGQAIGRETRELIERAVRALPEKYRDPFVLSDIEGLPNAEIGGLLGLSLPAVKSRLHRARLLLRDALKSHFEEQPAPAAEAVA